MLTLDASRLFLTGYRGTGKSTVGRLLAERLDWACLDSDDEVERQAESTIAELFANQGEDAFRDLEADVVAALCGRERTVVALGGGAVLRPATRKRLATAGPVVWLNGSADTLARRLAADATTGSRRPSLTDLPAADEVRRLLAEREPIYRSCATVAIDTEGLAPTAVADRVLERLSAAGWRTSIDADE